MYYISWNNVVYLVYFNEITQEQGQHILFFFAKTNLNNFSLKPNGFGSFFFLYASARGGSDSDMYGWND